MRTNAPGTSFRTSEKSSEPVIGLRAARIRSGPYSSAITSLAKAVSLASLTVTGHCSRYSTSAVTPCAAATECSTRTAPSRTRVRASGENERMVAWKVASSGITFTTVPARKTPTVITTGSNTSKERVTKVCNAVTISQAGGMGSRA